MIDKTRFAERFRELRNNAGLSQNRLASLLGVSGQAISKWENEHSLPDIDLIPLIANVLNTTTDYLLIGNIVENKNDSVVYPSIFSGYDISDEDITLLSSISSAMPRSKLYKIAKLVENDKLKLSISLKLDLLCANTNTSTTKSIDINKLDSLMLQSIAKPLASLTSLAIESKVNQVKDIVDVMKCPKCSSDLEYVALDKERLVCCNSHSFNIINGVVDFGYREQYGNNWSFCYKTYEEYYKCHSDYNPKIRRPKSKKRFTELVDLFKQAKPSVFIDAGTGEGMGIGMLLKEINWPCTAILTDLSHRILWYNKRLIEELKNNPYVNIVYLACDLKKIPLKDNSVDCIWSLSGFANMGTNDSHKGIEDSYRVLKHGGKLIYDAFTVSNDEIDAFNQWLTILYDKHPYYQNENIKSYVKNIEDWKSFYSTIGFASSKIIPVSNMYPLPEDMVFPWENEVLQWVGSGVMCCIK